MTRDARTEWQRCRSWIEAALEHSAGTHTIEDIEGRIAEGTMHFWPGKQCAAVTEVAAYPRKKLLSITYAGGDLNELLSLIPVWKSWGAHLGCSELIEAGRPGWERVLGRLGWKKEFVVLSTPIEGMATDG